MIAPPKIHLPKFVFKNWFWLLILTNTALWVLVKLNISKTIHDIYIQKYKTTYNIINTLFWIDIFISIFLITIPILQAKPKISTKINLEKPWIDTYQNFAFVSTLLLLPILRIYEKHGFDFTFILLFLMPIAFLFLINKLKKKGIKF